MLIVGFIGWSRTMGHSHSVDTLLAIDRIKLYKCQPASWTANVVVVHMGTPKPTHNY